MGVPETYLPRVNMDNQATLSRWLTPSRILENKDSFSSDEDPGCLSPGEQSETELSPPALKRCKHTMETGGTRAIANDDDDTDFDLDTSSSSTSRSRRSKQKFNTKWLSEFPNISYDIVKKVMFCTLCHRHKKNNAYAQGTKNFRRTNILRHIHSCDHKMALEAEGSLSLTSITMDTIHSQKSKAVVSAMRNVYWLAKEEVATLKYSSLNQLLVLQGCSDIVHLFRSKNAEYTSYHIAEEMQDAISLCLKQDLKEEISKASAYGILVDESTDIGASKNLIVYIRLVNDHTISTHFLTLLELDSEATGQNIADKIFEVMDENGIDKSKCVGFASDGARNMTGKDNGTAAILKKECLGMIAIHCIAHRLALASSQASNQFPALTRYKKTLIAIYSHFSHSSLRLNTLHEVQNVLDDPRLRYKPIYDVRWLSFYNAVNTVKRTLSSLLAYFEQQAVENDDAVAKGLAKQISSYSFVAITHLLCDVLGELTRLSKVFQKDMLDYSVIAPSVNAAISSISGMKSVDGPALTHFKTKIVQSGFISEGIALQSSNSETKIFESLRTSFLSEVVANLEARFPEVSLLSAMSILTPQNLPKDQQELLNYGNTELDVLVDHFESSIGLHECREEWPSFKQLVALNYSSLDLQHLWPMVCKLHRDQYPFLIKLAHACLAIPVSTATCERGFSTQNRIKNKLRNRMQTKRLDILMRITEEGPDVNEFDFDRSAKLWCEKKERRLFRPKKK